MLIAVALENFIMFNLNLIMKTKPITFICSNHLPVSRSCNFSKWQGLSIRLMKNLLQLKVVEPAATQVAYLAQNLCQSNLPSFCQVYCRHGVSFALWPQQWVCQLLLHSQLNTHLGRTLGPAKADGSDSEDFSQVSVSPQVSVTPITACHLLVIGPAGNCYVLA